MIKFKNIAIMAMAIIVIANIDQINGQVCRIRKSYNQECDNKLLSCDKKRGLVCDASLVCKCNTTNGSFDLKSGNCVATCPPGSFPTVNKTCVTCENSTIFDNSTGTCFSKCPPTFVPDSANKTCVCPPTAIYQVTSLQNNTNVIQCLSTCPAGFYPSDALRTCISCLSTQTFNTHLQVCVNLCPTGSEVDTTAKTCSCPKGQFLNRHTGKCEAKCPPGLTPDSRNTCSCPAFFNFANSSCVATCPNNSPNDPNLKLCFTCPGSQLFTKHTFTCADSCVDTVMDRISGVCSCPATAENFNPFTFKCNSTCGPNSLINEFKTCLCPSTLPIFRLDNLNCVASCPNDFLREPSLQICYNCSANKLLDKKTFTCVDNCPSGTFKSLTSKSCITCSAPNEFFNQATESCVESCSKVTGLKEEPANSKICVCEASKPYLDTTTNECRLLSECSARGLEVTATKTCKCPNNKPYWTGTQCVDKCLAYSTGDSANKTCTQCLTREFYDQTEQKCVPQCSTSQITIAELKLCITCPTGQLYDFTTSKCVSQCPTGTVLNNNNTLCVCSAPNQFIDVSGQKCSNACPSGTAVDPVFKRCLNCSAPTPFFDPTLNNCVEKCPKGLFTDQKRQLCVICPFDYFYMIEVGICIKKCPGIPDTEKNCRCNSTNPFYNRFTETCVSKCDRLIDNDAKTKSCTCFNGYYKTNQCEKTCDSNKFDLLKKCTATCTALSEKIDLENFECKTCNTQSTPFEIKGDFCSCKDTNNIYDRTLLTSTCTAKTACIAGKYFDPTTNTCNYCPTSNQFYLTNSNTCFDVCPTGATINLITRTCSCPTGKFYNPYKSSCVDSCPTNVDTNAKDTYKICKCPTSAFYNGDSCSSSCIGLFTDTVSRQCVECPSDKKFFTIHTQTCSSSCPTGTIANGNECKCQDNNSFYNVDKKTCETSCDSSFTIDSLRKTCSCIGFYNIAKQVCEETISTTTSASPASSASSTSPASPASSVSGSASSASPASSASSVSGSASPASSASSASASSASPASSASSASPASSASSASPASSASSTSS
ncbi:unnamed protein product [Brachionus calyciflorus]|uniref:Uncharacterized protein n=1 Tax=Brachionus calyciflorus TaxID=104777 RepID=A0A814IWG9_9BILA|nr:unnamed protein product [Brachionus calyciflorus]